MRKIDDKKILNLFKKNDKYEIKSTGNEILSKFELENQRKKALASQKKTRNIRLGFMGLGAFGLAGGLALVTLFLINPGQEAVKLENVFNPSKNETLKNQMVTFSSFGSIDNEIINNKQAFRLSGSIETNIEEDNFYKAALSYDSIQEGIKNMESLGDTKIVSVEENFSYQNVTYLNQDKFYKGEDTEPFAIFYYSDSFIDEEEKETKGLYFTNEKYYEATLEEEVELDGKESEKEVSLILKELNVDEPLIYVVENEVEKEANESESCYSYGIYEEKHLINDDLDKKNALYYLEYEVEVEDEERESTVRLIEKDNNVTFENIIFINENESSFRCKKINDYSDLNEDINLKINEDGSRTYTYKELTKNIK